MKCLITGISGFAGSHLSDLLIKDNDVIGFVRPGYKIKFNNNIKICEGDLQDYNSILTTIEDNMPDVIFHLASKTYVLYSFQNPITTMQDNCLGTLHLLEAVRYLKNKHNYDPIIHCCSTSEVYGKVYQNELPITENNQLRPMSPYAVSKVSEDLYAQQYFYSWGLKIIRSRAFSHTGPRRNPVFAVSNFAKQIAEMEINNTYKKLFVGNLSSVRTFCDVRDIVRAYVLLVKHCVPGEVYNICGNTTLTIQDIIDVLRSLSHVDFEVMVDTNRLRPSDVVTQIPDCTKFKNITNWEPVIPFKQTLQDLLDYWRKNV